MLLSARLNQHDFANKYTLNYKNEHVSSILNPVSKTPEHKGTHFISGVRSITCNCFYFVLQFLDICIANFWDYLFSLYRAALEAIYVYIVDSFTLCQ